MEHPWAALGDLSTGSETKSVSTEPKHDNTILAENRREADCSCRAWKSVSETKLPVTRRGVRTISVRSKRGTGDVPSSPGSLAAVQSCSWGGGGAQGQAAEAP